MAEETGRLLIVAERSGSVAEISAFLSDLENAYLALYTSELERLLLRASRRWPFPYPIPLLGSPRFVPLTTDALPPDARLTLARVRIESPGAWEFIGSLNPLQQIREYLKDRHSRRQDREYRENLERDRLELENELLRNKVRAQRIEMMRDIGIDDEYIRGMLWSSSGVYLSRLGRHQDSRLISGAE